MWPGRFLSQIELRYLREHARGLGELSATRPDGRFSMTGAGDPLKITVERVSGDLFETLGHTPLLGRPMRPTRIASGWSKVLVLTTSFWQRRFGGDPSVDRPHGQAGRSSRTKSLR